MQQRFKTSCSKSSSSLVDCLPRRRRVRAFTHKRYRVKPRYEKLFDALELAGWEKDYSLFDVHGRKQEEQVSLPPENIAAIKLLDSWLNNENGQDHSKEWEEIKQAIDENRLSERKLFSS